MNIQNRGMALITVLLVIALAVIVATKMNSTLIFQVQRTENLNSNEQAYWYAMGAEAFAKTVLKLSFKESEDKDVTHLGQIWAAGESSFPVDMGEINGEITDLQSCFNLNSLNNINVSSTSNSSSTTSTSTTSTTSTSTSASTTAITNVAKNTLIELIVLLELEGITSFEAESMADSLYDWLDSDSMISGSGGAEDNDYASKKYPYLAANSLMTSVNELRLVEHFTPEVILALKDYVCVLPNNTLHGININTIDSEDPKLLQALFGGIDKSEAEEILSERGDEGFESINDFESSSAVSSVKDFAQFKDQFVVDSEYFNLKIKTSFNNSYFNMNSIMKINTDQSITVISRTVGAN